MHEGAYNGAAVSILVLTALPGAAEVLVNEDFEGKGLGEWKDVKGFGKYLVLTDKEHVTGRQCLEVRYSPEDDGPWMHRYFPGRERVFVRYYRKWAEGWEWPKGADHDTYLFAGEYRSPVRSALCIYTDLDRDKYLLKVRDFLQGLRFKGTGYYTQLRNNVKSCPRLRPGKWYCIETMAQMNTPGKADGELKLWLDGVLLSHHRELELRSPDHPDIAFDHWLFGPLYRGVPKPLSCYIDSLVISTEPVGPVRPKKPAAARREKGESVWKLIVEKEKALKATAKDPLAEFADAIDEARKEALAGRFGEAARTAEALAFSAKAEETKGALLRLARGFRATAEFRKWVIEGAAQGRRVAVSMNVMGIRGRVEVVGADDSTLKVTCMGVEVQAPWEKVEARSLLALARRYAACDEEVSPERARLLEDFCEAYGVKIEK